MPEFELDCPEIFNPLARIDTAVQTILEKIQAVKNIEQTEYYEWEKYKAGKDENYTRIITLTGSTLSIELPFSNPVNLKQILMWFDSTNARTYNIRLYGFPNPTAYFELKNESGSIATTAFVDLGDGYKLLTPQKLEFNFSDYTADDKLNVLVICGGI
jgi:hypothetical protein